MSFSIFFVSFVSASTISTCKCFLTDFALLGHVIDKTDVFDDFECHLKCIGNRRCKSCNVNPNGNDTGKRVCELNSKTRQTRPGDFKRKKGSTYYGSIQVSQKFSFHITYIHFESKCG